MSTTATPLPVTRSGAPRTLDWFYSPKGELTSALTSATILILGWLVSLALKDGALHALASACPWISLAIGIVYGARAALESLRELKFDIDVLMFVGAVLAAFIGAPSEGALLLILFSVSGALEELAMARTKRAVEALHKLMPTQAQRWDAATSKWTSVEPESLVAGDRIQILPGEIIPADSRVLKGDTSVDQATLTGESMPRDVRVGDDLYAGTLNVGNPIEATITKPASESSLQKIVDLVTKAQQQRQPIQRIIDRFSQPYAVSVFVASIAVLLVWGLVLGVPWVGSAAALGRDGAIYTAITFLIVCSPCALIISTPTATLAAISRAARGGVVFKGGQAIERHAKLRVIAFDKTGTLTIGRPKVLEIAPVAWSDGAELLAVAAGLEMHSTHPIAHAIIEAARAKGVEPRELSNVKYIAGRGVIGNPGQGEHEARLGSLKHTIDIIPECLRNRVRDVLAQVQSQGQIAVVCAYNAHAAVFILADAVRPGAECLVERLHELGVKPVVMLTGDNEQTAAKVAEALHLDRFYAQLLPQDKVTHVAKLKRELGDARSGHIGVIGDGVNDAPALAAADVSIGIGSIGSDAALESADIVLLSDDLSTVPWATGLARRAKRTILLNISFALGAILVMALTVLSGRITGFNMPLWLGVVGHEGGTLLVVLNSLLLLAYKGVPVCSCSKSVAPGTPVPTPLTLERVAVPV